MLRRNWIETACCALVVALLSSSAVAKTEPADVTAVGSAGVEGVVPARLLETRVGAEFVTVDGEFEGLGRVGAGSVTELLVAGRGGVPAGASVVVLNVGVVGPDGAGFVSVFPCGGERPHASSVNVGVGGVVVANAVVVKVGVGGKVCVFSSVGTDLIVDVTAVAPEACTVPAPSAPPVVTAVDRNEVELEWDSTEPDGCPGSWEVETMDGTVRSSTEPRIAFDGLMDGVSYAFRVRWVAPIGVSEWSPFSASVLVCGVPEAPHALAAVAGDESVLLTWAPPFSGGCPILGYELRQLPSDDWLVVGEVTSYQVTGLSDGTTYTFAVRAVNARGASPDVVSAPVTPGPG